MKNYIKHFLVILCSLIWILSPAFAQDIIEIDYMRLPKDGSRTEYLEVEKLWKPFHQEYVNRGDLDAWFLYEIPYPGGTDAEYHFATVRIYKSPDQAAAPMTDMMKVFKTVHPRKDTEAMLERTDKSRDLVKTYSYYQWESFFGPNVKTPSKYATMVYFKVPLEKSGEYQDMEKTYYHPTHKAEIEAGVRDGWAGLFLRRPMGSAMPFQYVAVDFYKDYKQYNQEPPTDLFEEVFPDKDPYDRDEIFYKTAELVNLEDWHLVDYVNEKNN